MEIEKRQIEQPDLVEENGKTPEHLQAFWDFCLDFFGKENDLFFPHPPTLPFFTPKL